MRHASITSYQHTAVRQIRRRGIHCHAHVRVHAQAVPAQAGAHVRALCWQRRMRCLHLPTSAVMQQDTLGPAATATGCCSSNLSTRSISAGSHRSSGGGGGRSCTAQHNGQTGRGSAQNSVHSGAQKSGVNDSTDHARLVTYTALRTHCRVRTHHCAGNVMHAHLCLHVNYKDDAARTVSTNQLARATRGLSVSTSPCAPTCHSCAPRMSAQHASW